MLTLYLHSSQCLCMVGAVYANKTNRHLVWYFFLNYCAFQKQANSKVQKPTKVCVFRCHQSPQWTSQETELYLNGFKRSWFVICDWQILICFVCFCVSKFIDGKSVIMTEGSKKRNCEGGYAFELESSCVCEKRSNGVYTTQHKLP